MARTAAFFDVDRTLLSCNSGRLFLRFLRARGEISWGYLLRASSWLFRYQFALIDLEGVAARVVQRLSGLTEAEFATMCRDWVASALLPMVLPEARRRLDRHRELGHTLALLSTSPSYIVAPLAESLAVEHVGCTRLEVCDGAFTGRLLGPACYGPAKISVAESLIAGLDIDLGASWFYSDSVTDLPMLERVGNPVVVNPDPRLRRVARVRGWPVEDWISAAWRGPRAEVVR